MKLDAEIDRLYGLPLDEFVGARGELAKRLRKDGDREAADRVKALRKPTLGAWALNQAVRRRTKERDKLLAAGKRLREAHEALLSGGDPAALRKAMAAERELAGSLADAAEAIATETGKGGAALKERVRGTLHAAALDDEVRDELAAGRVVRERDAVGMGPFGAVAAPEQAAGGRGKRRDVPPASRDRGAKRDAAERRRSEREQAKRERAEQAQAERSLAAAHAALAKAEATQEDAAGKLDAASRALSDAKAAEREARKATRERAKAVAERERELEQLRAGG